MLRRIIYFLLVIVLLGGLGGAIAWYAFDFKPQMIAGFIKAAPKPVETISAEPARQDQWDPQVGAIGYEPGDTFLICSDGLTEGLYGDHLVEFIREEQGCNGNPAHRLVDESLARDGRDNVTALVIETLSGLPIHPVAS